MRAFHVSVEELVGQCGCRGCRTGRGGRGLGASVNNELELPGGQTHGLALFSLR